MATTTSALDPNYQAHTLQLRQSAASLGPDALQRRWPTAAFVGSIFDLAGLSGHFDRQDLNLLFEQFLGKPRGEGLEEGEEAPVGEASVGQLEAVAHQVNQIAGRERSWRSRLASPVRLLVHARGRKAGHGLPGGVHALAERAVQDSLAAGVDVALAPASMPSNGEVA